MLEIRRTTATGFERLDAPVEGGWLSVVAPTASDIDTVRSAYGVPASLLEHVGDADERPRVEQVADCVLVVLQYPVRSTANQGPPWRTLPISVIMTPRGVVTISLEPAPFLAPMTRGHGPPVSTTSSAEFVLRTCRHLADAYLGAMRDINVHVDQLEDELKRSLRNKEVLGLLEHQKSLTYFATGMKSNDMVLQRFEHVPAVKLDAAGHELLEDVQIEMRQAIDMVDIAYSVLGDMMDAFASIVSNNLNVVMKALASLTILLAVPVLIASIYGMNVDLPGSHRPEAFWIIAAVSIAACVVLFRYFRARHWL